MRKVLLAMTLSALTFLPALARDNFYHIQLGAFNPVATETGFIVGLRGGKEMDRNIDIHASIDWNRREVEQGEYVLIETPGAEQEVFIPDFKSSVSMIPLFLNLNLKIRIPQLTIPLMPYAGGGAGYVMAWHAYDDYRNTGGDVEVHGDTNFYGGFGYRIFGGAFYQIGSASKASIEIMWQGAKPTREVKDGETGIPIRTELNMSGMAFRVGLRFGGMPI